MKLAKGNREKCGGNIKPTRISGTMSGIGGGVAKDDGISVIDLRETGIMLLCYTIRRVYFMNITTMTLKSSDHRT
jgi:hypothetical protein